MGCSRRFALASLALLASCAGEGRLELGEGLGEVVRAAPPRLAFRAGPGSIVAGRPMALPVEVAVVDGDGAVVGALRPLISLSLAQNPGGAFLSGRTTVRAAKGVASFGGLTLDRAGERYTLVATAPGLDPATSAGFDVSPGPAAKLAFTRGPSVGLPGVPLEPSVEVEVQDASGNRVPGAFDQVTVALGANPAGGVLTGVRVVDASDGVARFSGLSVDRRGAGYSLVARAPALAEAAGASFDIVGRPASATRSTVTASPAGGLEADGTARATITVTVRDEDGAPVEGEPVHLAASGSGNLLAQPLSTDDAGVATGTLASTVVETKTVTALLPQLTLAERPLVSFLPALPTVTGVWVADGGGCVAIDYSVRQLQGLPVEIAVEYDPSGAGPFQPATQLGGAADGGITVATSGEPGGQRHTFIWDSTADLPLRTVTAASVRVSASVGGRSGAARVALGIRVQNGLAFAPAVLTAVSGYPTTIISGDFDADGRADVAVSSSAGASGVLSVLVGNGNGAFRPPVTYPPGGWMAGLASADFNGDDKPDLVSTNGLTLLLNNGNGTFRMVGTDLGSYYPTVVAAGDFDGDGKTDLVVGSHLGDLVIAAGRGDGTFGPGVPFPGGVSLRALAVGDFDADGKLDVAAADEPGNAVRFLRGTGAGGFLPPSSSSVGPYPYSLVARDFDADGKLDLATASNDTAGVSVLLGNGNGTFRPAVSYPAASDLTSIASADLDGDGALDLAVASLVSSSVLVLRGKGDGTFEPATGFSAGDALRSLVAADFNADGRMDLAGTGYSSSAVGVLLNTTIDRCQP